MSRARDFADLAGSADAGGLTGRSLIINGAMQVAQRSTSKTGIGASSGYFTLDRHRISVGNTAGRLTMSQASITDLPGFANALKLDCTTADTSIAANEDLAIQHRLEGQDLQVLQKGTSSAQPVTVSFYMKTNKAFTFMCELDDTDNNRVNTQQFTTTTSWTRHSLTFTGDTTGTLNDDANLSMRLNFWLHAGSNFTGGTYSANTWQSRQSSDNMRAVGIGSFFDNTANEIHLTGLKMEVGHQATPFEHRSFGDELARCQRYYIRFPSEAGSANSNMLAAGMSHDGSSNSGLFQIDLPNTMRANPTLGSNGTFRMYNGGTLNLTSGPTLNSATVQTMGFVASAGAGLDTKDAVFFGSNGDSDAYLEFKAEL